MATREVGSRGALTLGKIGIDLVKHSLEFGGSAVDGISHGSIQLCHWKSWQIWLGLKGAMRGSSPALQSRS